MNDVPGTSAPDISVVLATYDRRHSLPRAIASVLAQGEVRFELIVVDDASRDGTAEYLATLSDPRIRTITAERNGGPSAARNLGLKAARTGIVAFLDSDDAYLPHRLAAPLAAFAADASLVCTLSSAVRHDRKRSREARIPAVRLAAPAFEWALICDLVPVEATSITVRREAALAVGGFCERLRLIEDREFLIRLAREGGAQLLSEPLWEKFWGDDNLSNNWTKAGSGLVAYARERLEIGGRYRKVGAYLGTKVLIADLRLGLWRAFWRDLKALHAAGLIGANVTRLIRDHRDIRRYRRAMSGAAALGGLVGPPAMWKYVDRGSVPRTASMERVLKTLYHPNGNHRLVIVQRSSGHYGYEEETFSNDPMEMGWLRERQRPFHIYDSADTAEREARDAIGWLKNLS